MLSAERVEQLSSQVERAQLVQQQLEHKMDYIAAQQRELKRLQAHLEAAMTQAPALSVQQETDLERENTNHMAEDINSELNSASRGV
uniref:Nuclear pore complex protein Nup62 n=1 Tax=Rhipicephalus appendiculatus TaxID=34631 RepID=A0A131YL64_RHIAP